MADADLDDRKQLVMVDRTDDGQGQHDPDGRGQGSMTPMDVVMDVVMTLMDVVRGSMTPMDVVMGVVLTPMDVVRGSMTPMDVVQMRTMTARSRPGVSTRRSTTG